MLLDKFVAICEEASKIVSATNIQNSVVGCTSAGDTIGEKNAHKTCIVKKNENYDGLFGTNFGQVWDEKVIIFPIDKNEHEEKVMKFKRKGKLKPQGPYSQQGELESHTKRKKRKSRLEVTEILALSDNTNINKRGRNRKNKNTKTRKTETDQGGDQIVTRTLSDTDDGEKTRETTSCSDVISYQDKEETDPDGEETARELTSCSDVTMKSDNKKETGPSIGGAQRETTPCSDVNSGDNTGINHKSFADVTEISQETEKEKRCRTLELMTTKICTTAGQIIKTNSELQVKPGFMESVDFSRKNNGSTKATGNSVMTICAHCDTPVKDCHCPIGPKGFKKKCPGCPLRFLDSSQWFTHYKEVHGVWCVECDFHHMREVRVAQHMYLRHKRLLNEEKYPILKCDAKVWLTA